MLKSLVILSILATTTVPVAAGEPGDAVRYFYDDPGALTQPENRVRFTGPALDFLNAADAAWERDETVCIDFGFAVDAQDYDEAEIAKTLTLDETVSGDDASVTAQFSNFGQTTQIEWTLHNNGGSWLISDIASKTNGWRVSALSCE